MKRLKRLKLILGETPVDTYALCCYTKKAIILNANALMEMVQERTDEAKKVGIDLGDPEDIWICKFASIMAHENIHRVLDELEGRIASKKLDYLCSTILSEFLVIEEWEYRSWMAMCDHVLYSDAQNTNPLGDTWFK
jgi:hypothetical protein